MSISAFLEELAGKRDLERAVWDRNYHKSAREHWGVPVPSNVKIVKNFCKNLSEREILELAEGLWNSCIFDAMISSGKMLGLKKVSSSPEVWSLIKKFLFNQVDGWALEDLLAPIAWKLILSHEKYLEEIELWTLSENFWIRRAALVYTLPFAKEGKNPEKMLKWMGRYATDSEWFIQKAIGWWLRVLSTHNSKRVLQFLAQHQNSLKGVAKREATRKIK